MNTILNAATVRMSEREVFENMESLICMPFGFQVSHTLETRTTTGKGPIWYLHARL